MFLQVLFESRAQVLEQLQILVSCGVQLADLLDLLDILHNRLGARGDLSFVDAMQL